MYRLKNFNVAVDSAGFNMSNVDLSVSVDVGGRVVSGLVMGNISRL